MTTVGLDREELELILQTLKNLGRDLITDEKCLQWDEEDVLPMEVIRRMLSPDVGLHLVFLPEDCGGLGGGAHDIYRVSEEMARLDLGIATAFLAIALGSDPLRVGATDEQRQRWLGRVAEEGLIVAYGVTEPEAGSNVASLKTVAEPVLEGDRVAAYRINGTKQFISNGSVADLFTILAKAPGGPSFFVVQKGAPGLTAGRMEVKHGIRSSNTAQVILEDVVVPADQLIGLEEGKGLLQANEVFGFTRLMVAAFGLGAGGAAMQRAIAYSRERKQFGKLLCAHRGFTHKLIVPHMVRLEASRSYIEEVAARLDSGEPGLQTEGSIAKLYATETGNAAAEAAIQAHGGYGYTREYLVEKIKRDVRITTIYEGTSEIQQSIIYLYRFKQNLKTRGALYEEHAARLSDLASAGVGAELVARATRALGHTLTTLHQLKVSRAQHVQFELALRITEVEHANAFCRRAARAAEEPRSSAQRSAQHETARAAEEPRSSAQRSAQDVTARLEVEGIRAACRLFAAEAATNLAVSGVRLLAAAGTEPQVIEDYRRAIDFDQLLTTAIGSDADRDTVVQWVLQD